MNITVIPGTNRTGAKTLLLAKQVAEDHRALGATVDLLELDLGAEFLAGTAYKQPTPGIKGFVDRFLASDGVVFVVPEYNGSFPGVLKLFLDMLPYPAGFDRRPCAFIGLSSGQFGGLRAVEHLQAVAGYRNAHLYPPRVFIAGIEKQLTPEGALSDPKLVQRLKDQAAGFQQFVKALRP
ncbi:ACP phosphodiesterase [Planctomycetota bacterium]|nr:ACP phosphodiesterase [Planctomycetota bacterium]